MRVLFLSGRELSYPRSDVMLRAFKRFGDVEVIGPSQRPVSLLLSSLLVSLRAIPKLIINRYDLVYVGFFGHFIMLLVNFFSRSVTLFDVFISTYDTLVHDRKVVKVKSLASRLAFWLDRAACLRADHILLDTTQHVDYFRETFSLTSKHFSVIPVGCNEDLFHPRQPERKNAELIVLYYSTYMPLHGVEVVVQAADIMRDEPILFRLVGNGPCYPRVESLVSDLRLENVKLIPYLPLKMLPEEITGADICLGGHFGNSEKGGRVIPGKIYQIMAMERPMIAAATPANNELLVHMEDAYLCQPDDVQALVTAISVLQRDDVLRDRLAADARRRYEQTCSEAIITKCLQDLVAGLLKASP
jgi:glycosyltransferase involved in cell wall biosynthesis